MKKLSDMIPIISEQDISPLTLKRFTAYNEAPNVEPWLSVLEIAKKGEEDEIYSVLALIINGVLTENKTKFLFSKRILQAMVSNFTGKPIKGISGSAYNRILARLTSPNLEFMTCVKEPSRGGPYNARAGLYEIKSQPILEYLNK